MCTWSMKPHRRLYLRATEFEHDWKHHLDLFQEISPSPEESARETRRLLRWDEESMIVAKISSKLGLILKAIPAVMSCLNTCLGVSACLRRHRWRRQMGTERLYRSNSQTFLLGFWCCCLSMNCECRTLRSWVLPGTGRWWLRIVPRNARYPLWDGRSYRTKTHYSPPYTTIIMAIIIKIGTAIAISVHNASASASPSDNASASTATITIAITSTLHWHRLTLNSPSMALHLHQSYVTFTLHVRCIYITITLHLHYICITFTLHLHYIYPSLTSQLHLHYNTCTIHIHYMYITCTLHVHYMYITWTLRFHCIYFTLTKLNFHSFYITLTSHSQHSDIVCITLIVYLSYIYFISTWSLHEVYIHYTLLFVFILYMHTTYITRTLHEDYIYTTLTLHYIFRRRYCTT